VVVGSFNAPEDDDDASVYNVSMGISKRRKSPVVFFTCRSVRQLDVWLLRSSSVIEVWSLSAVAGVLFDVEGRAAT
jgi:hypothetical protein